MYRQDPSVIRYQLIAQNQDNRLVINILGQETCFLADAREIMKNPSLLNGFTLKEAALIGYIAGALNSEDRRQRVEDKG